MQLIWYFVTFPLVVLLLIWACLGMRWGWVVLCVGYLFLTVPNGIAADPLAFVIGVILTFGVVAIILPWSLKRSRRRRLLKLRSREGYYRLRQLSPDAFERRVADYMREVGFSAVRVVGGSSDRGVDIRARADSGNVLVQCKRYTSKNVGVKDVREFLGCLTDHGSPRGIFVTTAAFTPSAIELANSHAIELWDGKDLAHRIASLSSINSSPRNSIRDRLGRLRSRNRKPAVSASREGIDRALDSDRSHAHPSSKDDVASTSPVPKRAPNRRARNQSLLEQLGERPSTED